ncbi:hypothetical protein Kpol_499p9 [Vanderwaltozyma polyspora DSM 70294]|uniref:6-phosphofructo-2-kinase domain-containing protein n=1 Tax=Vanderwaltozyma polyspora (strain ATCC 22028 / DSM 70294 / BCRC 21397 / CBS 2163 / NBRC 10782 / NRRL Y-8283 / UCD 57-17) TaxID=436907 RepID=A7TP12_VANPO|nr:uncharacterized protein Kpol_499p9 [Vanderwaltozyma polyspora DSM 70294]EDO15981.1 hypothetical protein Kpol_499p9 [Vanderwaltozyma polyspora DSM 70294]
MSIKRLVSNDEELVNGLGSEHYTDGATGNHMARKDTRWVTTDGKLNINSISTLKHDGIHDPIDSQENTSPGQLYSTQSGKLFHAGKIMIVLVGLPASSKTLLSVAISRYSRWLGVRTESFHASEYRKDKEHIPDDYYSAVPQTQEGRDFKTNIIESTYNAMANFYQNLNGQLAIYDALNIRRSDRKNIETVFSKLNVKVLFIESIINNEQLMKQNIMTASQSSEFQGLTTEEATEIYMKRLSINKPLYEEMTKQEKLCYVKYYNFGEKIIVNNNHGGYLINKIVYFLMNIRNKKGRVFFARCGTSNDDRYMDDEFLNDEGLRFAKSLTKLVIDRFEKNKKENIDKNISSNDKNEALTVLTAPRKRAYDTAKYFKDYDIPVIIRSELQQQRPGLIADMNEEQIKEKFPMEYEECLKDPYHFRFPRAESYHDLSIRMEPLLLEMERLSGDVLIVGHDSTLRVLYGYFMASNSMEVPKIDFSRNELVEITFTPFQNEVTRIPIVY